MKKEDLDYFRHWFDKYTASFLTSDIVDRRNLELKIRHSLEVCSNMRRIGTRLGLKGQELLLAEVIGLFHDIGRFEQYRIYHTFKDSISENHGRLGAKILKKEGILKNLSSQEEFIITETVRFHSAFGIPKVDGDLKRYIKLIRDADKLDIWRVFVEYYESPPEERASVAAHGLPDNDEFSEEVVKSLINRKMVLFSSLRTLNDFKLMHLSWVYDINFKETLLILREKGYIERIINKLPFHPEIEKGVSMIRQYIEERLKEDATGIQT